MDNTHRIFFKGNPFPQGHGVETFRWSGRLDPEQGLFFDFFLQTANYDAEDDGSDTEEEQPDWLSKSVWNNYHKCTMASKERGQDGILVATADSPYSFGDWDTRSFTTDPLPLDKDGGFEDLAFGIYLLGHDSCAGHLITITSIGNNHFNIHWTGKIALTYVGEEDFKYDFEAFINDISFDGIYYPKDYTQEQARQLLGTMVSDAKRFGFEDLNPKSFKREYKSVLI